MTDLTQTMLYTIAISSTSNVIPTFLYSAMSPAYVQNDAVKGSPINI